jgi:uncharacterized protein YqfB (UPF0267 family)
MIYLFTLIYILKGPFTITIGDTSKFSAYEGGGMVVEVKKSETVKFVSFSKIDFLDENFVVILI